MTANDRKSYPSYLNKLEDQYNNTYHRSIGKKLLMLNILLWMKSLRQILKLLNLKLIIESELLRITIFLVKVTLKICQEKHLLSILLGCINLKI